jgi:hypothetical protein
MQQNRSIENIAKLLNGKASKKGLFVYRINSLKNANEGDISFYTDNSKLNYYQQRHLLLFYKKKILIYVQQIT